MVAIPKIVMLPDVFHLNLSDTYKIARTIKFHFCLLLGLDLQSFLLRYFLVEFALLFMSA